MGHSDSFILVWRRDFDGLEAALQRAVYKLSEKQLAQITVPTLLIGAAKSNIKEDVARTAAAIPDALLFWLRGATHFLNDEQGRKAAEITNCFLAQIL